MRKHSIFKKLIYNMLPISIIPFLLVLMFLLRYTCMNLKNEAYMHLEDRLSSYVQIINTEKNNALLQSDYIINNTEMRALLESRPENLYDRLLLLKKIESYALIISANNNSTITIYTDNPAIRPGMFTDQAENLSNWDEILDTLQKTDNIFFDKEISYDELQNPYLALYRRLLADTKIIIKIKIYIPTENAFSIVEKEENLPDSNTNIIKPITNELFATAALDQKELNAKYLHYTVIFSMVGLLFCAIIILASLAITKRTTNTISEFILKLSKQSIQESLPESESITDSWELSVIKSTLNEFIKNIDEQKEAHYKAELEKRRLELELLQSKIDPHMLYNSLGAISHKAYINNDLEMYSLIKNLTDYYRLVLSRGRDFITIEEEVRLISKFISVNEISHLQKYEFYSNIDPRLLKYELPHLMLQPFVENSIVHGLAGKEAPCIIRLDCSLQSGNIIFKIFDNGYGIEEDKLSRLTEPDFCPESYGIRNTFNRMKLFFGEACSIHFESHIDEFTEVTISIPADVF
ncbi:MAG: hypothetical protein E7418_05800 [Ruminococcaceae bacterium]|nr:hypothetical protein [Oscillospiraceae bacterium]